MKKTFQELQDETLIADLGEGGNICDISIDKLRSPTMKKLHKGQCPVDKKEKDTGIRRAAKRAGLSRSARDKLYNSVEEKRARKKKVKLPPHLAKFFDKKGNPKPEVAARIRKARALKGVDITDVTPDWMFPNEEVEEGYQEIQNLANLIKSETDRLVKAAKKGDMKTVMAIYRTIGKIIK